MPSNGKVCIEQVYETTKP